MPCCRVSPLHLSTESTTVLCKSGATKSQLNQLLSHTDSSCVCLVPSSSPLCYNPYFLLRTTFPSAYDDDHTGAVHNQNKRWMHLSYYSIKAIQREVDEKEDDECLPSERGNHLFITTLGRPDKIAGRVRSGSMATRLNDKHKEFVINCRAILPIPTLVGPPPAHSQPGQSFYRSSILLPPGKPKGIK